MQLDTALMLERLRQYGRPQSIHPKLPIFSSNDIKPAKPDKKGNGEFHITDSANFFAAVEQDKLFDDIEINKYFTIYQLLTSKDDVYCPSIRQNFGTEKLICQIKVNISDDTDET